MSDKKNIPSKEEILAALPEDVRRVQVTAEDGSTKFRKIHQVEWTDTIMFNKSNQPIVMRGASGRPSEDLRDPLPTFSEEEKKNFVPVNRKPIETSRKKTSEIEGTFDLAGDPILKTVQNDPESVDVLHHVMQGLAEEAAAMSLQRRLLERDGKNTSNVSAKRVTALRAVGDTWLKRKEQIGTQGVDLKSPAFKRVFSFIMETFRGSLLSSSIRPEQVEVVFAKLANRMGDDWMREAQKKIEGDD